MALWNKNRYSQNSDDEKEADFDLILSDEDFEDEEESEEIVAEGSEEEDAACRADACADESDDDDCGEAVGEFYDMNEPWMVSAGVYSSVRNLTGADFEEEYLSEDGFAEEYIAEEQFAEEDIAEEQFAEEDIAEEQFAEGYIVGESFSEEYDADGEAYAEEEDLSAVAAAEQNFGEGIQIMDLNAPEEEENEDTFGAFLLKMMKNKMVTGSALLALVIFVVAAVVVGTGRGSEPVNAFSTVSSSLEDVDVIGGDALAELMTSKETEYQATLLSAVEEETTVSREYEEIEETKEIITISLVMTSVEKDLKIKFTNKETGKLIANIPFEVKVMDGDGNIYTWTNDDKDGIIYKSGLTAGTYRVSLIALEGELYENYDFSASGTVTVRDTIVYEKVDVSAEIKDETEINVATEEAQVEQVVESVNTDTVEWVESTKTLSEESYTVIDKSLIAVPTASSVTRSFLATAITNNSTDLTLTEGESETISASSDTDGAVLIYESSDTDVATVSEDGTVTAIAAGSATITISEKVTNTDGGTTESETDTCTVTVNTKAAETTVATTAETTAEVTSTETTAAGTAAVTTVGTTAETTTGTATETATETAAETTTETTTETAAETTTEKTAETTTETTAETTTEKTAETTTEKTAETTAETTTKTTEEKTYDSFTLSASALTLTSGGKGTISVTTTGATEGESLTYKYTSSDTGVATVTGSGSSATVTAVSAGSTTIKIKAYYDDSTDVSAETTCTVTVSQSYSDFTLSLSSSSLSLNKNASSTVTVTPQNTTSGESVTYTYESSDTGVAEVYGSDNTVTVKALEAGTAEITVNACYANNTSKTATATFTVTVTSSSTALKTTDGRAVYVLENGDYRIATYDDYYTDGMAYYVKSEGYTYTGWQTIDGNTYYYTADGNYVVGDQVIQGVQYAFSSTGVLQDGSGTLGIDVSSHNGSIDWTAVKNSGVSYAIIRCGYRGYGSGVLVEDSRFRANIQGALNAGLEVGVYFFSQAVTTTEAVEEASMVLQLISGYSLSLPVYIDVEYANSSHGGRADSLGVSDRTAIVKAFCQTIQNSGYTAGIYANKTWLTSYLDMSQLGSYKVWLAQYAASPTYTGSYHMWQYSSSGSISGISGNVDLNLWYY